jgi:osmoprotectant transport system substrate-binding protein
MLATALALVLLAGCGRNDSAGRSSGTLQGPIVVGSKIDTEGALLAHMIMHVLRDHDFKVTDRSHFGPTQMVRKALLSGEIDIYPEYTGNGAFFFDETGSRVWHKWEAGYERVKTLDRKNNNVVWLPPAPANNTWAIAVPEQLAEEHNLRSLRDFARYVNEGGRVKLACSQEFVNSEMALPAIEETYGFDLTKDQLLTLSGGNTAQAEKAAARGTDGVNVAMAYGTDGAIEALNLRILTDPEGSQPVYAPAPVARGEILEEHPEIRTILQPVFQSLDAQTLRKLNGEIVVEGRAAAAVSRRYLESRGLLD